MMKGEKVLSSLDYCIDKVIRRDDEVFVIGWAYKLGTKKVDIKNELPHLIKLLIDRIEITKVNNNRKHVRMVVYFNFNTDIIDRELDLYEKKEKPTIKVDVNSLQSDEISFNQKCSCIDQNIRSGLYENINVGIGNINDIKENDDSKCCRIHQNEPRIC